MLLYIYAAGTRHQSSSTVVDQSSAVCQVPHVHHPDGRLLHRQHRHLAQLDVQNAAHASHAQVGPTGLHQVPAAPAAAATAAGSPALSTGIGRKPVTTERSWVFTHPGN